MASLPTSRRFGTLPNGEPIELWTLRGDSGLTLEAITYGGIITRLILPDGTDVVLGFDDLNFYVADHPFFGAITGRVAGRITGARFTIEGVTSHLAANQDGNNLHSGPIGFDKRIWQATPRLTVDGAPFLRFRLISEDGDQGFPGELDVNVDYTVTADNTFIFETTVTTTKATPVSITQHAYFNLAGHNSGGILDHTLQVNATRYVAADENFTLLDRFEEIDATTDLRQPRLLSEAIHSYPAQHGFMYAVDTPHVARLTHPPSGRILDCHTDAPYLQVYTAVYLDGTITGKSGAIYNKFAGLCLEAEGYPNAANAPHLHPGTVVRPGETQRFRTAYKFSSSTGAF